MSFSSLFEKPLKVLELAGLPEMNDKVMSHVGPPYLTIFDGNFFLLLTSFFSQNVLKHRLSHSELSCRLTTELGETWGISYKPGHIQEVNTP